MSGTGTNAPASLLKLPRSWFGSRWVAVRWLCHDFAIENKTPPVEAVDRALLLLIALRDPDPLSVKAAAGQLDVAPSMAHRLLSA